MPALPDTPQTPAAPETAPRVVYNRVVIEPLMVANGHKPKAIVDVNSDGLNDVIVYTEGQGLYWYRAPDWARFQINAGGSGEQARAADIDGDGDIDVVVGGAGLTARWYANPLRQGQDPAAVTWTERTIGGTRSHDLEIADFDGDGRLDVVVQDAVLMQDAGRTWTSIGNSHFPGRNGQGTALGDLDGDGDIDLVDSSGTNLVWYENPRPAGNPRTAIWTARVLSPGFSQMSIRVADLNGDGRHDVLLANEYGAGGLAWLEAPANPRSGRWLPHMIDSTVNNVHQSSILVGDLDKDGHPDVVIAEQEQSTTKRIAVYYNVAGNGHTWQVQVLATTGGHNPKLGDIDNDGDLDILNANHGFYDAPNPVEVFRNRNHDPLSFRGRYCWPPQTGVTGYQAVQSAAPDFPPGCEETNTSATCWDRPTAPRAGTVFFYLVRGTAPTVGSWGQDGTGAELSGICQ